MYDDEQKQREIDAKLDAFFADIKGSKETMCNVILAPGYDISFVSGLGIVSTFRG